ncbi:sigma-54 interaction domain-containing protein [Parapusillimonas granuli]|uniref:Sigma-54-dependent Fis family transcriptional regulator n=1 Tax=Parapusillimonas granuli TaxID=380911 RepID=A0A853FXD2_9BURK|nr:sigma-54 dependent transcriptional regulator [Parapusillimonas granuli]MBB5214805.1 DNA-binding NtrC family response regulator [Parapusillimonas granuli]MEB2397947.1 sigma-54 dependent transcriptional regulator [Alcaligenaceae bacterium]NYT48787.1 sigma-54-dependent Fis family transcriptional regulator [Parapusillimonas granuli]
MINSSKLIGRSPAAFELARSIVKAAPTDAGVLIVGESGTGKEVVARAIHQRSARCDAPFVAINCGAISASLAETAFFGHEKGSFTGAAATAKGCFETADGGTLFLDEVTEMPLPMQVQLLRVLETGQYHRVGGMELRRVHVRIIAATNRDPKEAVRSGRFRSDLLYRLAVFPIRVPALRERQSDIAYLAQRFLDELNAEEKTRKMFSDDAIAHLEAYNWPGNVRELKNTVTRAYILANDVIEIGPLAPVFRVKSPDLSNGFLKIPIGTDLANAQHALIQATLEYYSGDKRRTAAALGISPKTLYNRLEQMRNGETPAGTSYRHR